MKKINKKGFTLLEVLTSIIIITILMMITLPLINSLSKKNSNELYHSYEKMMEEYVIAGQNKNKETVLLSEIDGLDQIKKECKGYVSISQDNPPIYKAYIKCGDFGDLAGLMGGDFGSNMTMLEGLWDDIMRGAFGTKEDGIAYLSNQFEGTVGTFHGFTSTSSLWNRGFSGKVEYILCCVSHWAA